MDAPVHARFATEGSAKNPSAAAAAASDKGNSRTNSVVPELFPGQDHLVKLVVTQSLPMLFQDSPSFQNFVNTLNPAFPKISSVVLRKVAMGYYTVERESLLHNLRDLGNRVSITCSVWSDPDCEVLDGLIYLYLNCHWIDEEWEKQNRVLGFLRLDHPMKSENVSSSIMAIVSKWELEGKVFSITFGNDMRNSVSAAAVSELQTSLNPMFDGQLSNGKCAYHIVDSCMELGFSKMSSVLDKVRYVVDIVDCRGSERVKGLCRQNGLRYKRIALDVPSLGYTTYEMLDAFIQYRDVLTKFSTLDFAAGKYAGAPLTEDEWSEVCSLRDLLERFKSAFDILCNVYVPTSNLVIPLLFTLSEGFAQYRDDKHVGRICAEMEAMFSAYWLDVPMVYCLATILDPRYKLDGLFKLLDGYHGNMKATIVDGKNEIQTLFYKMYEAYSQVYFPPHILEEDLMVTDCCGSGTKSAVRLVHGMKKDDGKEGSDYAVSYSELNYYLSSNDLPSFTAKDIDRLDMFGVLKWWKRNQARYPVLATMALDLLAPLPSAKVPEGTFDFHASDVNEKRREIPPKTAEMSVCLKDWFQAETREQCLLVDVHEEDVDSDDQVEEDYDDGEEEDYDEEEEDDEE